MFLNKVYLWIWCIRLFFGRGLCGWGGGGEAHILSLNGSKFGFLHYKQFLDKGWY